MKQDPGRQAWSGPERPASPAGFTLRDSEQRAVLEAVAEFARDACEAPVAVVHVGAGGARWFRSEPGTPAATTPLDRSICRQAMREPGLFVVPDLAADPRFARHPAVAGEGALRFCAGAPIETPEGLRVGVVCVLDRAPRPAGLSERQGRLLAALARQAMCQLDLRRALADRTEEVERSRRREAEREAAARSLEASEARLRQREAELARVLRIGRVGGFDIALREGLRSRRSPEYLHLHGLPADTVQDGHAEWVARLHPEDRARAERHFLDVVAAGARDYGGEYRIIRPSDGALRWIAALAEIEHDEEGPVRMVGVHADVTDRREAEERRRKSEAGYRALFEQAAVGVARMSLEGAFREVNDRFCEITGQSRAALLATDWQGITHPEDLEPDGSRAADVAAGRRDSYRMEKRYIRPDGSVVWVHLTVNPLRDASGRPSEVMAVVEDVTERRRIEESRTLLLRELDHRVKNLFAVAEGMVQLTARASRTPQEMALALSGRLAALARAHDLIRFAVAGEGGGAAVPLGSLAAAVLAPHLPPGSDRLGLSGPALMLGPEAATGLALVLHELATNAAKYGALSTTEGRLELGWAPEGETLALTWRETGGPAAMRPQATGFGTRLAELTVQGQLGGRIARHWPPEGLRVEIELPLGQLGA